MHTRTNTCTHTHTHRIILRLQGPRSTALSCTDKIAKWTVVGVQGALLSHFVEPVYLTGLVVGELYDEFALTRGIVDRIPGETACLLYLYEDILYVKVPSVYVVLCVGVREREVLYVGVRKRDLPQN